MKKILAIALCVFIASCSANKVDPFEPVNRKVYMVSDAVDKALLRPVAYMYQDLMPDWGKDRIGNALTNLTEPVTFLNSIFQLDGKHAYRTFCRFFINSTVGLLGTYDVAGKYGLEHRSEDFGQTIGVYAKETGPYIYLPFLGPSTARDVGGRVVDFFIDPFNYVENDAFQISRTVAGAIVTREKLLEVTEEIDKYSFDPYTAIRSGYLQHRKKEIENE